MVDGVIRGPKGSKCTPFKVSLISDNQTEGAPLAEQVRRSQSEELATAKAYLTGVLTPPPMVEEIHSPAQSLDISYRVYIKSC